MSEQISYFGILYSIYIQETTTHFHDPKLRFIFGAGSIHAKFNMNLLELYIIRNLYSDIKIMLPL